MSVLIKNIKIPESCAECRFCVNGFTDAAPVYECACESYENVSVLVDDHGKPFGLRPDWCPLVEVPTPHGRLGDLDKLWDRMYNYIDNEGAKFPFGDNDFMIHRDSACELVEDAHTIIEAEGSEDEQER